MSPARISDRRAQGKPVRVTYKVKPVSLPTFSCYGFLPVVYADGELLVGRRVVPQERRP